MFTKILDLEVRRKAQRLASVLLGAARMLRRKMALGTTAQGRRRRQVHNTYVEHLDA